MNSAEQHWRPPRCVGMLQPLLVATRRRLLHPEPALPTPSLRAVVLALLALVLLPAVARAQVPTYAAGQSVEVREGDRRSPATFEKQEGRRHPDR